MEICRIYGVQNIFQMCFFKVKYLYIYFINFYCKYSFNWVYNRQGIVYFKERAASSTGNLFNLVLPKNVHWGVNCLTTCYELIFVNYTLRTTSTYINLMCYIGTEHSSLNSCLNRFWSLMPCWKRFLNDREVYEECNIK